MALSSSSLSPICEVSTSLNKAVIVPELSKMPKGNVLKIIALVGLETGVLGEMDVIEAVASLKPAPILALMLLHKCVLLEAGLETGVFREMGVLEAVANLETAPISAVMLLHNFGLLKVGLVVGIEVQEIGFAFPRTMLSKEELSSIDVVSTSRNKPVAVFGKDKVSVCMLSASWHGAGALSEEEIGSISIVSPSWHDTGAVSEVEIGSVISSSWHETGIVSASAELALGSLLGKKGFHEAKAVASSYMLLLEGTLDLVEGPHSSVEATWVENV